MSTEQVSQRRSMIAGVAVSTALHTRQRGVAPRWRRGLDGPGSARVCGAMPVRKRDGRLLCRPPGARASAQLSSRCVLALVIPTYSSRRSSSTASLSAPWASAWLIGSVASARPTRYTASHSKPLAACSDASVTPCTVGGCRASARSLSSATSALRSRSGRSATSSSTSSASAPRASQRSRALAPAGGCAVRPSGSSSSRTTGPSGPSAPLSAAFCSATSDWRISWREKKPSPPRTWKPMPAAVSASSYTSDWALIR